MSEQKSRAGGALGGFLGLVGMSAVAGVLVAAAVTPAIALSGVAVNSSINMFEQLPGYLAPTDLAESSNIYVTNTDGSNRKLATFYDQNRQVVQWDQISQFTKDAAVAGEDPRFYEHGGIDMKGTLRAAVSQVVPSMDSSGGSSITQQYVKNVLLEQLMSKAKTEAEREEAWETAAGFSTSRKLQEMRYAITLEKTYPKDEILRGYLNIALFGGRVYGIQAAAQYYFGVNAIDLNIEQSATLIAMVNNPANMRIDRPDDEDNGAANGYALTLDRRNYIINEMLEHGKITAEQHAAALATAITPVITPPATGCDNAGGEAYFCDYVVKTILNNPAFGADEATRKALLERGGLEIFTTLDVDLQTAAAQTVAENVPQVLDGVDIGGTVVSVQPGTGKVLAMAQNKTYSQDPDVLAQGPQFSAINYNTDFEYGGSSGFQPASTYKIFTVGEWLKEGHSLNETVDGRKRSDWGSFRDTCNGGTISFPGFSVGNDEGGNGGTYSALTATRNSVNTGFIAMAKQLDLCGIKNMAESFGVHRADGEPLQWGAGAVLGTNEIAPLTMAGAFAGIAANGIVCEPVAIERITHADGSEVLNADGTPLVLPNGNCAQKVDPAVAAGMAYALQDVMKSGSGQSSNGRLSTRVPVLGKTGTSDDAWATWMSGATTKVATVAGVFNVTGHVNLRKVYFPGLSTRAADMRHWLWPDVMSVANAKFGGDDFASPPQSALKTVTVAVPDVRGKSIQEAQKILEAAGFGFLDGGQTDSELPAGQVAATNPAGEAPKGSVITVQTSNGQMVLMPNVIGKKYEDARSSLGGYSVSMTERSVSDQSKQGAVIESNPAPGAPVKPGSAITLVVGRYDGGGEGPENGNNGNGNG